MGTSRWPLRARSIGICTSAPWPRGGRRRWGAPRAIAWSDASPAAKPASALTLPDDAEQVRGIDVGYLSPAQVARLGSAAPRHTYVPESPALIAEVISASERAGYIKQKLADYFAGGAALVWLLFPARRTVRVCRPDGTAATIPATGTLDGAEILPGFSVALANLFA